MQESNLVQGTLDDSNSYQAELQGILAAIELANKL